MKSVKPDYIRFLIDSETKKKFKKLAKEKNTNMSDMLNDYIKKELEKENYNKKNQIIIQEKSIITDEKIQIVKEKMRKRNDEKKSIFKIFKKWFKAYLYMNIELENKI